MVLWDIYERTRAALRREVKRRIVLGTYALSSGYYDAYYVKRQQVRTLIKQDSIRFFEKLRRGRRTNQPTVAFPLGAKTQDRSRCTCRSAFTIRTSLPPDGYQRATGWWTAAVGLQIIGKHSAANRAPHRHPTNSRQPGTRCAQPVAMLSAASAQPSAGAWLVGELRTPGESRAECALRTWRLMLNGS